MFRNAQTHILVTVIALLVWVLAEAESVRVESRSVDVVLLPDPEGKRAVRIDPAEGFDGRVTIELEGPAARTGEVAAALPRPFALTPDLLALPPGEGKIGADLKAALARHPVFANTGVRPSQVRPASLPVVFDDLVTRELRVAAPQPEGLDLESVPEVSPPTVLARIPAALARTLDGNIQVQAVLDAAAIARLVPGRPLSITGVRVEFPAVLRTGPFADFLRTEPPTVTVSMTRRGDTAQTVLASVPVRIQIAPIDQPHWDISVVPDSISNVTVQGPRDLIARIEAGRALVFGVVSLTWAELEPASTRPDPLEKDVSFQITGAASGTPTFRTDEDKPTVRLTIRRRPVVGPPPPGEGN